MGKETARIIRFRPVEPVDLIIADGGSIVLIFVGLIYRKYPFDRADVRESHDMISKKIMIYQ